jgi:hypothetical protein
VTVSGGIGVPIDKGKARIVSGGSETKLASGFSARLGIDFYSFRRDEKRVVQHRAVDLLHSAMKECATDQKLTEEQKVSEEAFYAHYGLPKAYAHDEPASGYTAGAAAPIGKPCTGESLIAWMLETERDTAYTSGDKFKRPKLASGYWALFWDDGENVIPTWGGGVSYEHIWNRFDYRQAQLNTVPDPSNPGNVKLEIDERVALLKQNTDKREGRKAQVYLSRFFRTWEHPFQKPRGVYTQGFMGLISLAHEVSWEYRQSGLQDYRYCEVAPPGDLFGPAKTSISIAPISARLTC